MDAEAAARNLGEVKNMLIENLQANQNSPTVMTMTRQCIDHLDATYLFFGQLAGFMEYMAKAPEEKLAAGDVLNFSGTTDGQADA
jgi:hypothetical protein